MSTVSGYSFSPDRRVHQPLSTQNCYLSLWADLWAGFWQSASWVELQLSWVNKGHVRQTGRSNWQHVACRMGEVSRALGICAVTQLQVCATAGEVCDSPKSFWHGKLAPFLVSPRIPRWDLVAEGNSPYICCFRHHLEFISPPSAVEEVGPIKLVSRSQVPFSCAVRVDKFRS